MKLFGSKKEKQRQPTHDNKALDNLINDMPTQVEGAENTPVSSDLRKPKEKKGLFGSGKKAKKPVVEETIVPVVHKDGAQPSDNSTDIGTDDFLASLEEKPKHSSPDIMKWLLALLFGLLALMVLYYIYSTFIADNSADTDPVVTTTEPALPTVTEGEPVPVSETEPLSTTQVPSIDSNTDTNANIDDATLTTNTIGTATNLEIMPLSDIPDPEEILTAELPETEVAAREEIDRLADEASQLEEQGKLIADQVAMMDELTVKKEEQIELLEQQIALLEAQKNTQ